METQTQFVEGTGRGRRSAGKGAGRNLVLAIARKEFLHIVYDPRTLSIVFLMPVVQLLMFGYAMNLEVQHVDMAVLDLARTRESRALVRQFDGSRFFDSFYYDGPVAGIESLFKTEKARVALIIPPDFDRRLRTSPTTPLQFVIDASDANAAAFVKNYCTQVLADYNQSRGAELPVPFGVRTAVLFNPNLKSSHFFVPGIMAMILMMVSALLTSVAITREKETGTMEQMLVSPVRPQQIVAGKVLPYVTLAFLDAVLVLVVGLVVFHVPFRGNVALLLVLTVLYVVTALSLGLMISTSVRTQQVAMMAAMVATILPTIMLSGLIFPIASMPKVLQAVTYLVPARYYLLIVRGVMLKGSGPLQLLEPTAFLAAAAVLLLAVSVRRFSMNLER
ncbi:MAG: ABC transporter permease [Candidatus Eisenbacteria bacterium]|nr:ABC transporter permease [Candidatus Eisenbacteria bacterium]